MNIFKTNNVKMYTKTLQNTYFKINFKGTFPTIPTGVCNEIFTTKETCPPPHLKLCILFYRIYRKGTDFTCMSVFISKSCQKS